MYSKLDVAYQIASNAHFGQKDKSGEPYFKHVEHVWKQVAAHTNGWHNTEK